MARSVWRHTFDKSREFSVRRPMTIGGKHFAAGKPFPKTLVTTRRLRQFFDQHRIVYADDPKPGASRGSNLSNYGQASTAKKPKAGKKGNAAPKKQVADPGTVDIPEGWRELSWQARRKIASQVSDMPVKNSDDANAAIELEVERRASEG